jgi:large subunit ribosomal protein L25
MRTCIQAENRSVLNRSNLRKLREEGRLPGVVFGKHMAATMIHISTREFQQWIKTGGSGVMELSIEGQGKVPVLLEGVQRHPVTKDYMHADFLHVRLDEIVRTKITIEFTGTPAGVKLGGILQMQGTFIDVEGLPDRLPSSIAADISGMAIGDSFLVENLPIPPGVTVISPAEELLVTIVTPRLEQVENEAG